MPRSHPTSALRLPLLDNAGVFDSPRVSPKLRALSTRAEKAEVSQYGPPSFGCELASHSEDWRHFRVRRRVTCCCADRI